MDAMTALALAAAYLALFGFKAVLAWRAVPARGPDEADAADEARLAQVCIVQPILSGDPQLARVLEDNLRALPRVRFFWLIDEDDAEAQAVTALLRRRYGEERIRVQRFGQAPDGVNPKTFKLDLALPQVDAPVLLVLDDDARLPLASLRQLLRELEGADLVTALPCCRDDASLGARLLAQFVNNNAALTYLPLLRFMPPVSINGMCWALRTQRLRALGGFVPIRTHLADDLAVAGLLIGAGARLRQSTARVEVQTSVPTLRRYRQQMHRWFLFATLLLRRQPGPLQALIALLHGLPPLLLAALLGTALLRPSAVAWAALAGVLAVRGAGLCALQSALTGRRRHRPLLSLLSELLQPLHLLHAAVDRTILWRKRVYRVIDNHDFHELRR